ncbi:MAG: hypothetical protein VW580_03400, partial [Flavobacteriaceae bacterium]
MKYFLFIVFIFCTASCVSDKGKVVYFETTSETYKIPSLYVDTNNSEINYSPIRGALDSGSGSILLKFSHKELESEIKGFTTSESNPYSLVLLYNSPVNHSFLIDVVKRNLNEKFENIEKNVSLNAFNIYSMDDSWDIVTGEHSSDKGTFLFNKYIASCDKFLMGESCSYYSDVNAASFSFSLNGGNNKLYKE